jgi:hypothetical protein
MGGRDFVTPEAIAFCGLKSSTGGSTRRPPTRGHSRPCVPPTCDILVEINQIRRGLSLKPPQMYNSAPQFVQIAQNAAFGGICSHPKLYKPTPQYVQSPAKRPTKTQQIRRLTHRSHPSLAPTTNPVYTRQVFTIQVTRKPNMPWLSHLLLGTHPAKEKQNV